MGTPLDNDVDLDKHTTHSTLEEVRFACRSVKFRIVIFDQKFHVKFSTHDKNLCTLRDIFGTEHQNHLLQIQEYTRSVTADPCVFRLHKQFETLDVRVEKCKKDRELYTMTMMPVDFEGEFSTEVLKQSPMVIITLNEYDIILGLNAYLKEIFGGYNEIEFIGKNLNNLIKNVEFMNEWKRCKLQLENSQDSYAFVLAGEEFETYKKDGTPFKVRFQATMNTVQGKTLFSMFILDANLLMFYNERMFVMDELQIALLSFISSAKFMLFTVDKNGVFIDVNKQVEIDFPDWEFRGKTVEQIFDEKYAREFKRFHEDIKKENKTITREFYLDYQNERRYYYNYGTPRRDSNGNFNGLYFLSQDITEYKRAILSQIEAENQRLQLAQQLAERTSQLKSEFLARMSHELRTPLSVIIGTIPLLEQSTSDPIQKDNLDLMKTSSGHLLSLVNDILDFSKIEAGRITLEVYNVDVWKVLQDMHMLFSVTARQKGLKFIVENQVDDEHRFMLGDYGRIVQVISNIMNNAVKFTYTGHVILRAYIQQQPNVPRNGTTLVFEVVDTGIGISDENQRKLFRPFSQVDESTTRRFGGTGLGLSIASTLVELMKGEIGVKSKVGEGSTFWVKLPYSKGRDAHKTTRGDDDTAGINKAIAEKTKTVIVRSQRHFEGSDGKTKNILVVEDNPMIQKVVLRLIRHMGYNALGCNDGHEALEILQSHPNHFWLVFMDLFMPVMDGYEATKEIRKLPPPVGDIIIIAMTANALPGEKQRVQAIGMDDYMTKPVSADALQQMIEMWLNSGISNVAGPAS